MHPKESRHTKALNSTAKMCLHTTSEDRWVSGMISNTGRWPDCDRLTYWYLDRPKQQQQQQQQQQESTPMDSTTTAAADDNNDWYIDIGANIGSCVMQVLMTTNASIAAFEPDPRNLFHLTSTLSRLPSSLRRRVYVVPVALGALSTTSEIHVASDNRGNAVVGQQIKDRLDPGQTFLEPLPIVVERMDDLLHVTNNSDSDNDDDNDNNRIRLVKMDAQGYECNIVQGASTFFEAASTVVFELESIMLRNFPNCNETVLYDAFAGDGTRKIYNNAHLGSGLPASLSAVYKMPKTNEGINLVARKE